MRSTGFVPLPGGGIASAVRVADRRGDDAGVVAGRVVRRLRLTEKQQGLIQQLIDAMAETMRKLDLDLRLRGAERRQINQLRDKLFDDYLRRALDLLTPEQQAEWKKLHDEPTAKQSPAL